MPDSSPRSPNVIVFFTDQQRWDTTGVHGNPLELTPNFDRMAQRGTHVYNAITCQPVCAPARASLQTGLYATRTTVYRNGIALPGDQKTLAHYFGAAGYRLHPALRHASMISVGAFKPSEMPLSLLVPPTRAAAADPARAPASAPCRADSPVQRWRGPGGTSARR